MKTATVFKEIIPVAINYISKPNSKMPCRSWDLQAGDTCPGSFNSDGSLVAACEKCYAKKGAFIFSNVRKTRVNNKLAWQNKEWVNQMVAELDNDRYFRFCASGDLYHIDLWFKVYEIAIRSSHCKFWIPTRMYKFRKFRQIIDKLNALDNVVVRFSSDSITGQIIEGDQTSTIIPTLDDLTTNMILCSSYANGGKCLNCRNCWNKGNKVIAYLLH